MLDLVVSRLKSHRCKNCGRCAILLKSLELKVSNFSTHYFKQINLSLMMSMFDETVVWFISCNKIIVSVVHILPSTIKMEIILSFSCTSHFNTYLNLSIYIPLNSDKI
eukprot:sb/3477521/